MALKWTPREHERESPGFGCNVHVLVPRLLASRDDGSYEIRRLHQCHSPHDVLLLSKSTRESDEIEDLERKLCRPLCFAWLEQFDGSG